MTQFSSLFGTYLDSELGTDDSTVLFTTARRKLAINLGCKEFAKLTECLPRQSTIALTGGTAEYDLNSAATFPNADFSKWSAQPVEFRYVDASSQVTVLAGDDLPRHDPNYLDRYSPGWQTSTVASTTQQMPEFWYERLDGGSRYLGFTPVPSTGSSASMTAIVPYIARPAVMTSDTSEPFTIGGVVRGDLRDYHQATVHYAAHHLEKLRRDDQASDRQFAKFLSYVSSYLQEKRRKGPKALTFLKNYFNRSGRSAGVMGQDPRR